MKPQNLPEKLVWYYIIGTYVIYLLGAQFVLAPLLAYFLMFYLLWKWWKQTEETPLEERIAIPLSTWVWIVATLVIQIALIIGHLDFNYGLTRIVKSLLSYWLRTWALFALFPLAGSLNIRPQIVYRAVCILCLQSLVLIPIVYLVGPYLPAVLYTSPLRIFGGDRAAYMVTDMLVAGYRLTLFAPFSPSLGLIANIFFCLVSQESNRKWRLIGMTSTVAMIVLTVSRAAIVCLPFVLVSVWCLSNLVRPWMQMAVGFASFAVGILSTTAIDFLEYSKELFNNNQFRANAANSSRWRATVARIGLERWWNQALVWGHGYHDAPTPTPVVRVPIGSHDTWTFMLYVYGLVGCFAFVVAFAWSFIDLLVKAQFSQHAKAGLGVVLVLSIFTFAVQMVDYSYMYWPGLLILGIAFKDRQRDALLRQRNWSRSMALSD
ncbi:O-antigen ligase domain-containing protein [Pleurocapsales cyanobacterium LEGE 10410]|nr:O-antigen ligase domain-containing protein [Pleurocapsales cyanobacterium LEGE 10410]